MLKALLRAFVDELIDNYKKVASSKKHTLLDFKMTKIDTLFITKTVKKPYSLGPHIPI